MICGVIPAASWYFSAPTGQGRWTRPSCAGRRGPKNSTGPTIAEREELFRMDLEGLVLRTGTIHELVRLTGPRDGRPGFTFSDLRSRLMPDALCRAFPTRALTGDDLLVAAKEVRPSPVVRKRMTPPSVSVRPAAALPLFGRRVQIAGSASSKNGSRSHPLRA